MKSMLRRASALALGLLLCLSLLPASAAADGTEVVSGVWEGFAWTLNTQGVLSVTGSGVMPDADAPGAISGYTPRRTDETALVALFDPPGWYACRDRIVSVVIGDGTTYLGACAFLDCVRLSAVTLPASLARVGDGAFRGCTGLSDLYFVGTQAQWDAVRLGDENAPLREASVHCCTVAYDANGGSGAPAAQQKVPGQTLTLSSALPVRSGWYFLGWAEDAQADRADFLPGGSYTRDAGTLLYALWGQPDFVLPAALTTVGEEAFANCAFRFAALPADTTSVGRAAFSGCSSLAYICIPAKTTSIDADAFTGVEGLTILGVPGSYAQTYAQQKGFGFLPVS